MKRSRILFIWTDVETRIESGVIHIGVAYLSAALKRAGHETALVRVLHEIKKDDLLRRVSGFRPDLIAFTVMTNQFDYCVKLADWCRERYDIPVIFGGHHPTLAPEEAIAQKSVDMLCRGEGEDALVELAGRIAEGRDYSDIANLWVKRDGAVIRNDIRPLPADLNALPDMDLDIYDLEKMFPASGRSWLSRLFRQDKPSRAERSKITEDTKSPGINLHFMAGRGCPYHCTYCCNPAVNRLYRGKGHVTRVRDVKAVIAELKHHIGDHPRINYITFQDETFSLKKDWLLDFCVAYRKEIGLPFSAMVRVNTIDEEMLRALKDAGCDLLRIGVESGSEWLRENVLKRKMTNGQIITAFDIADKIGIRTWAFAMIGLPHETPEMMEETFALLRRLNPNHVQMSIFYPYPGTELYDECREKDWLTDEKSLSYFEKPVLNLPTMTREHILERYEAFRREIVEMAAKKEGKGYFDFITNFDSAEVKAENKDYVGMTTFFEEYPDRFWLQAHPSSEITYRVAIPRESVLRFDIGMHPYTYDKTGKGVTFEVRRNGRVIFSKYLDAKSRPRDRGWRSAALRLKPDGKSESTISFVTRPAPRAGNHYCNAGWGRPRLEE